MGRDTTITIACRNCGSGLDEFGICRPCHVARSRRWYRENSTLASAQRGLQAKIKRRTTADEREAILGKLMVEQAGVCACCGEPSPSGLNIEWSLDEVADDGVPLCRAAICRSCKIAVNRVVHPSRFVLEPRQLAMVEEYLKLPWRDLRPKHVAPSQEQRERMLGAKGQQTAELLDWVQSL